MKGSTYIILVVGIPCLLVGCGQPQPRVTQAEGQVLLNGKPLGNVMVQFLPDTTKEQEGPHSSGVTNEKGEFVLKTSDGQDGAVVGWHIVTLEDLKVDRPRQGELPKQPARFPSFYTSAGKSTLKIQVTEDQKKYILQIKG